MFTFTAIKLAYSNENKLDLVVLFYWLPFSLRSTSKVISDFNWSVLWCMNDTHVARGQIRQCYEVKQPNWKKNIYWLSSCLLSSVPTVPWDFKEHFEKCIWNSLSQNYWLAFRYRSFILTDRLYGGLDDTSDTIDKVAQKTLLCLMWHVFSYQPHTLNVNICRSFIQWLSLSASQGLTNRTRG